MANYTLSLSGGSNAIQTTTTLNVTTLNSITFQVKDGNTVPSPVLANDAFTVAGNLVTNDVVGVVTPTASAASDGVYTITFKTVNPDATTTPTLSENSTVLLTLKTPGSGNTVVNELSINPVQVLSTTGLVAPVTIPSINSTTKTFNVAELNGQPTNIKTTMTDIIYSETDSKLTVSLNYPNKPYLTPILPSSYSGPTSLTAQLSLQLNKSADTPLNLVNPQKCELTISESTQA